MARFAGAGIRYNPTYEKESESDGGEEEGKKSLEAGAASGAATTIVLRSFQIHLWIRDEVASTPPFAATVCPRSAAVVLRLDPDAVRV